MFTTLNLAALPTATLATLGLVVSIFVGSRNLGNFLLHIVFITGFSLLTFIWAVLILPGVRKADA